jgi:Fic family protein
MESLNIFNYRINYPEILGSIWQDMVTLGHMLIPPKYFLTPQISSLLSEIEGSKQVVDSVPIPIEIENNIRRKSTLRSSLFSARIEGNPTTPEDLPKLSSSDLKKVEINNVLRAINWIGQRTARDIAIKDILNLHAITMRGIEFEELGKFRTKHEGIFSSAGAVIYHAPPPRLLPGLLERLLKYINSDKEKFIPVRAALAHYSFEKLHPFTDGSGRVGRLLLLMVLSKGGYGFKQILPFEEMIDKRRDVYYRMLEEPERDVTDYLEFVLEVVNEAAIVTKREVLNMQRVESFDLLLPRRGEILSIIKDQKLINFDSIRRRFKNINERTLRYDLKKLADSGFIQKLGTTRGVYYKPRG